MLNLTPVEGTVQIQVCLLYVSICVVGVHCQVNSKVITIPETKFLVWWLCANMPNLERVGIRSKITDDLFKVSASTEKYGIVSRYA